jgi:hypothetical protein
MSAFKTVLHEGDGIHVYNHPHPAIMEHGRIFSQELTGKLMQGPGMPAF